MGEILGEVFGDFDVGFVSDGFEVCGGVLGSDADFSVSFFIHGKDVKILVKYQSFRTSEDPAKPSYRYKTIEIHLIVRLLSTI